MAGCFVNGTFSMGKQTLSVPMELFALNRRRLCEALQPKIKKAVVLLQGGSNINHYCSDVEYVFQQESYFHWMFGVIEADFYGCVDVDTGKSVLFCPRLPEEYSIFMGGLYSCNDFKKAYGVDCVYYVDEMKKVLKNMEPDTLLTLNGLNTDSGLICKEAVFHGIHEFNVDSTILHPVIAECRVFKTELELNVLRYANRISSEAHRQVMRKMKPGLYEYQAEAIFLQYTYYVGGCRNVAYTCICAAGDSASVLHYGHAGAPNSKEIQDGELLVFDMGAKYCGYSSDITCTFPSNGKFTADQKAIYNAVLNANRAVLASMKPGVSWVDMHKLANKIMLQGMLEYGLLKGDIEDMMEANLGAVFQPHGLGHFMGIDVHDVGGYLENDPPRETRAGLNRLRTARVLQPGMVITVEPGCYFIDCLLDKALKDPKLSQFLVPSKINSFRGFGGVRVEDDVVVTQDGIELMTKVPRTVEEIEAFMSADPELGLSSDTHSP